jgi:transcriptional regulator with XRE-family HTH domain/mannose-6-phosphate isomerase-like protein (cupin superfamily)
MSSAADEPSAPSGEPAENLGPRLRQARLNAGLTLRELARQLGVSASFVSQLENGKSQPSVATLYSLSQLLDVSIDQLFETRGAAPPLAVELPGDDEGLGAEEELLPGDALTQQMAPVSRVELGSPAAAWGRRPEKAERLSVTRAGERTRLVMDSGVIWEQLARNTDRHIDFMEITYPAGSSSTTDDRMLRHDGYEYGYLLEGELQVTLGFDEFTLHAGEAMGLDSSTPHLFKNLGSTPARGIWFVHHRHD